MLQLHDADQLLAWATTEPRMVHFDFHVLDQLDSLATAVEAVSGQHTDMAKAMLQRLIPMTVKRAMLVATGWPETLDLARLEVQSRDATAA